MCLNLSGAQDGDEAVLPGDSGGQEEDEKEQSSDESENSDLLEGDTAEEEDLEITADPSENSDDKDTRDQNPETSNSTKGKLSFNN